MKFPTIKEMAEEVAEKALDEFEYKGKTLRQWIEIISASEHSTNLAEVGTGCISRQAVLNGFCHSCDEWSCNPNTCCKTEWIRKLPPIQPIQPKKGRWIGKYPVSSICSECGYLINDSKVKVFAFCPNCGAKMEVTT